MTPNREDYIQSIFKQMENRGYATNKEISIYLNISKSSVSEMVQKLREEGFVQMEGRKIRLTEKGEKKAKKTVSKHRLWEKFLQEELSFPSEKVHLQADLLEHATTEQLMEALNEYLGYPQKCPHGRTIYINEE